MANKVELYNNGTLIGTDNAPTVNGLNWTYSIPYTADSGNDALTAKAFVDNVEVASSGVRNVTINAGSSFDTDYQALLDAATLAGDPLPDSTQQALDNQTMLGLKSSGAYAKMDVILKAWGTAPSAFKRYCWKRKIKMDTVIAATWSDSGVVFGASNALRTKYVPSTDFVNGTNVNAGFALVQNTQAGLGQYAGGVRDASGTPITTISVESAGAKYSVRINGLGVPTTAQKLNDVGVLITVNKTAFNSYTVKSEKEGVPFTETASVTDTISDAVLPANELYFGTWHRADTAEGSLSGSSTASYRFIAYGASLVAEHNALAAVVEP